MLDVSLFVIKSKKYNISAMNGDDVLLTYFSYTIHSFTPDKVVAHMMPDLPNVGMERDMEQFREYFENPAFRSDGLKLVRKDYLVTVVVCVCLS